MLHAPPISFFWIWSPKPYRWGIQIIKQLIIMCMHIHIC
jgi:hypothetical protein